MCTYDNVLVYKAKDAQFYWLAGDSGGQGEGREWGAVAPSSHILELTKNVQHSKFRNALKHPTRDLRTRLGASTGSPPLTTHAIYSNILRAPRVFWLK